MQNAFTKVKFYFIFASDFLVRVQWGYLFDFLGIAIFEWWRHFWLMQQLMKSSLDSL